MQLEQAVQARVILDLWPDLAQQGQGLLSALPGVVSAQFMDGSSKVVLVVRGNTQHDVVERTIDLIIAVEDYTERVLVPPVILPDTSGPNSEMSEVHDAWVA